MKAWNSPKSTSASSPGRCSWPIVTPRACPVSSARTRATNARTVDSATCAPSSSHSRCHTRRAVWRCLRGAAWSSSSQRRTVTSCPPSAGASRSGGLRAGGTAHSSAWRTVRRCTRCRSASARMPTPSSRCSRRIRSNSSTLDISFSLAPMVWQPRSVGTGARGWGHFRPSLRPLPGPDQAVIPRWVHAQPYYRCSYPPEYRAATGLDLDHPRTVYLREADLLPHLDGWLAGLFDPASLEDTLAALEAASHDHTAAIQQLRTAEQTLADCQRQLAQYRAALDAGADPTAVTAWINQATAARAAAEAERARLRGACQPVWDRSAGKLLRRLRWVEGLVDPHLPGKLEGLGWLADEPLGMGGVGAVQDHGAGVDDLLGAAVVHVGRGQQRDPRVVVLVVVPAEEVLAEAAGVLDRAEPLREGGMLLQRLELAFRVRVVVGHVGAGVGLGDAQAGQQHGDRLGGHRGPAVGVHAELVGRNALGGDGVGGQPLGQAGSLSGGDHPADHVPRVDVQDRIQAIVGPFGWPV